MKLRNALRGTDDPSPIHVTLRGPYQSSPSLEQLQSYSERLLGYGVRIGSYGYFSTPKGHAAFLRAECTVFRDLWDKPDYKTPLDLIKPHVTMFESKDRSAALEVRAFLKNEDLRIHTYNISLSVYESKSVQGDMFGREIVPLSQVPKNPDTWRISRGILDRARIIGHKLAEFEKRAVPD